MEKIKDLKIDEDFCNVLPNISNEEYTNLEKSILHNGFLNSNPIILWNGFIVDGHKRYEICRKHNIQYIYTELDINKFQTKMDVIQFIIEIHFGRRSLTKA